MTFYKYDALDRLIFVVRKTGCIGTAYYKARYYDPLKGRFLQRDPIEYEGGTNLYEYVNGRPTFETDPSGNQAGALGAAMFLGLQTAALQRKIDNLNSTKDDLDKRLKTIDDLLQKKGCLDAFDRYALWACQIAVDGDREEYEKNKGLDQAIRRLLAGTKLLGDYDTDRLSVRGKLSDYEAKVDRLYRRAKENGCEEAFPLRKNQRTGQWEVKSPFMRNPNNGNNMQRPPR